MSKILVALPAGWDNKIILDSKDFATLCDIMDRGQGLEVKYHDGKYYRVAKKVLIEGGMLDERPVLSQDEYAALTRAPAPEEVTE